MLAGLCSFLEFLRENPFPVFLRLPVFLGSWLPSCIFKATGVGIVLNLLQSHLSLTLACTSVKGSSLLGTHVIRLDSPG